jgi:hypothetical protein
MSSAGGNLVNLINLNLIKEEEKKMTAASKDDELETFSVSSYPFKIRISTFVESGRFDKNK